MYSYSTRVRYSELDGTGKLSLAGIFNLLQDAAIFHCEEVGRGVRELMKDGRAWYVLGWDLTISRLPHLGDLITVDTWVPEIKGRVSVRHLRLRDEAGAALIDATSSWVMFDVHEGHAIRIPEEEIDYFRGELTSDVVRPRRIARIGQTAPYKATPVVVSDHHLDTNHHVNNVRYVEFALDALEEIAGQDGAAADVDYTSQSGVVTRRVPAQHIDEAVASADHSQQSAALAELAQLSHSFEHTRLLVEYRKMALLGDTLYPEVHPYENSACVRLDDAEGDAYAIVQLFDDEQAQS